MENNGKGGSRGATEEPFRQSEWRGKLHACIRREHSRQGAASAKALRQVSVRGLEAQWSRLVEEEVVDEVREAGWG